MPSASGRGALLPFVSADPRGAARGDPHVYGRYDIVNLKKKIVAIKKIKEKLDKKIVKAIRVAVKAKAKTIRL